MKDQTSHHKIVLRGHLNDYGNLFGGYLLQWVDEIGYISVSLDFPGQHFVTIGLENVEFKHSIREGQILNFVCQQIRLGTTSVSYHVKVYGERYIREKPDTVLFETKITFVCIDEDGNKKPIDKTVA